MTAKKIARHLGKICLIAAEIVGFTAAGLGGFVMVIGLLLAICGVHLAVGSDPGSGITVAVLFAMTLGGALIGYVCDRILWLQFTRSLESSWKLAAEGR